MVSGNGIEQTKEIFCGGKERQYELTSPLLALFSASYEGGADAVQRIRFDKA